MPRFQITSDALIRDGYLFKEAISLFSCEAFASWWLPQAATFDRAKYPKQSRPVTHTFPKDEWSRRILAFPSPGNYVRLTAAIEENWTKIFNYTDKSKISLSRLSPPNTTKRAIDYFRHPKEQLKSRLTERIGRRYYLHVDIARFFPSVYLHRFETIFPGTTTGTRNDGLGSKLDNLCRQTQGRESIGLPVGPDTSFILAESLGTYIDQSISGLPINAIRHVDDISIYAESTAVIEKCLVRLRQACDSLRLELNGLKILQGQVPDELEPAWVAHIRTLAASLKSDDGLVTICDRIFASYQATHDRRIINYGISAIAPFGLKNSESWVILQSFLLSAMQVDPRCIGHVGRILLRAEEAGQLLNRRKLLMVYNDFIIKHGQMNHGFEVCQALWSLHALDLTTALRARTWAEVAKMKDNFVAVTALWIRDLSGGGPTDVSHWRAMARDLDGYGEGQWLLCHEARVNGWFKKLSPPQEPFWQELQSAGVSFIQSARWSHVIARETLDDELLHEAEPVIGPLASGI